jgi:dihydrofolate reductase
MKNTKLILIAAVDKNRGLGLNNQLIIDSKADMQHFKETTSGHVVLMGRKTFESMNNFCLPNRYNYVLTRSKVLEHKFRKSDELRHFDFGNDVDFLMKCMSEQQHLYKAEKIFVIGGGEIYNQFINLADEIILTVFNDIEKEADTFFPNIDEKQFKLLTEEKLSDGGLILTYQTIITDNNE